MRHAYFGRKLSRTTNERRQLFRNLLRALIRHGSIVTTIAKAKSIQPEMEQLITKAKKGGQAKNKEIFASLADKDSTAMLMDMAKTRFLQRTSGFTRIIKMGLRSGDATQEAQLSFVDAPIAIEKTDVVVEKKKTVPVKAKKKKNV